MAVPFENLDIALGRPISLDLDDLADKVIRRHRGGYCYELNGLFSALLESLGYEVTLVSARTVVAAGRLSPEFDHLALLVGSAVMDGVYVADVGFGDAFLEPLALRDEESRVEGAKTVGIAADGDTWVYREDHGAGWSPQYVFRRQPRTLADFAERNGWQQTSPDSHFTRERVASLVTHTGRVTLSGNRLITTSHGQRTERSLTPEEATTALVDLFGIRIEPEEGGDR
jgi:N-hydroxyarylamine O-acetyltransferase